MLSIRFEPTFRMVATMRKLRILIGALLLTGQAMVRCEAADQTPSAPPDPLIGTLAEELDYSMRNLAMEDGTKPYFLAYTVTDIAAVSVRGRLGALDLDDESRSRLLDVDLRV